MNDEQMLDKALRVLRTRGLRVDPRLDWYEGRHPFTLGSASWNESYRRLLSGIKDNQCRLVVNARADAVMPIGSEVKAGTAADEALAQWVSDRFTDEAGTLAQTIQLAEASGEQTTLAVDFDSEGEVAFYKLDPRSCYVERDRAGGYLWAVHIWREDDEYATTQATIYTPTETVHLASNVTVTLPQAGDFREVVRTPNPFGELMLASVEKGSSVIDDIAPLNGELNKSLQTQHVVGEAYALPFRVWLGIEEYDPDTGLTQNILPSLNPATASRDVKVPTAADAEGDKREVKQFDSPKPGEYLAEQDARRAAIARLGSVPASMLQLGAIPASGEALEIEWLPHVARKSADERGYYRPFFNRVQRLAVRRYLYALTGRPMPAPKLETVFTKANTTTASTRMDEFTAAINAGMTLSDALVEFLGWDREVADVAQANAGEVAAAAREAMTAAFDAGLSA